jgi:hypothetical protein
MMTAFCSNISTYSGVLYQYSNSVVLERYGSYFCHMLKHCLQGYVYAVFYHVLCFKFFDSTLQGLTCY